MPEIWKQIEGYPGYEVSMLGDVRSLPRKGRLSVRTLKPSLRDGYPTVWLRMGKATMVHSVHRLVARAFLGESPAECTDVNHLNSDRRDNRIENLEWCTRKQNIRHAINAGRFRPGGKVMLQWAHEVQPLRQPQC
jgi:hypothetical protein